MIVTGVVEVKIRVAHQVNLDPTSPLAQARALLQRELEQRVRSLLWPCATGLLHPADITSPSRGVPNLRAAGAALQAVCLSCAGTKVLMGTCGPIPCSSCRGTGLA